MSRLAKSSHVVLREGAENLRKYGAPRYTVDRMAVLAEIARDNQREAVRLMAIVYKCLPEEVAALGDCDASGQRQPFGVTEDSEL